MRREIAADRAARYAAQAAARALADAEFLVKQTAEKTAREAAEKAAIETEELITKWKKAGKIGLIVGGVLIVGYGVYKVTPHIKKWCQERNHTDLKENDAA